MSNLVDLIQKLGSDAELEQAYTKDPDAVMREAGLSDDEIAAMKAVDVKKIEEMTGLKDLKATQSIIKLFEK